jgi:hypothetical protein
VLRYVADEQALLAHGHDGRPCPWGQGQVSSPTPAPCGRLPAVSLLTELDAFYTEHRL